MVRGARGGGNGRLRPAVPRRTLDAEWASSGRRLVVVGSDPDKVSAVAPSLFIDIRGTNPRELEQTLTRRPSHLVTLNYRFVAGRVTAPG